MKTDRFTDIIRRKLESIRPEFTDKDWARMQDSLKNANLSNPPGANQPFSGGVWSGQSWLLAAASISTVALIGFSIWQQREINQLRQAVGQLHPQSTTAPATVSANSGAQVLTRPDIAHSGEALPPKQNQETTASANRNEGQTDRPDTVYITRYVPVPSQRRAEQRSNEQLSQRQIETATEQRYATEKPIESSAPTRQSTTLTKNNQTESYDVSSTPSVANNTYNGSGVTKKSANPSVKNKSLTGQTDQERLPQQSNSSPLRSSDKQSNVAVNSTARDVTTKEAVGTSQNNSTVNSAEAPTTPTVPNETSATYELATSLPLSINSKNWNTALAQRARRMRPTQPSQPTVVAEQTKAPASIRPVQNLAGRFRAGIGAEVASRLWSVGVFAEALVGQHWTVGIGLSQATFTNRFITDEDFNNRTERDFRQEFARPIDKWREIVNIDTRQTRIQMPVNLGYRIPLSQSVFLLPTVGTYLNLSSSENVTYFCPKPQFPLPPQKYRNYEEIDVNNKPSVALVNNLVLGTGIEWQSRHVVLQASPVLNIPMQMNANDRQANLNWQQNTTLGARARILYQF